MRWQKIPVVNQIGDSRIVEKFVFLPECLHGEYRWLEFANVLQIWEKEPSGGLPRWIDKRWVENPDCGW